MDQLSAHLDRGWDLAQKGDAPGAVACARRAFELDPQSPEVHNLLGFSAALAGESEEALEHYRQAIALDETYLEAMLNAAEIMVHPLHEYEEAVSMCNDALDYAETKEEILDCILLKVDALLGQNKTPEAGRALAMAPEAPYENATHAFLLGRAYYEVGDSKKALPLLEEAVRNDSEHADAHYYLGLVRDEAGDVRAATEAFLKTRALDALHAPPAWAPSPEVFGQTVRSAITELDALLGRYVRQADVYVVDIPGPEIVVDGVDPRTLLIVDQAPPIQNETELRDRTSDIGRIRIFVYQRNVERAAGALDAIAEELNGALERELTAIFLERDPGDPLTTGQGKHQLN
jgi:tetratricopeptide (TPR) repeat protein